MSLVFAAITPHPPLLIPTIGKENLKYITKTKEAMEKLEEDLYLAKPDMIVVISPHGHYFNDAFSLNFSDHFETDLREFGDLATKLQFSGDMEFPYAVRTESIDHYKNCPAAIINEPVIDHGAAVPLYYLTQHLPNIKIVPVGFSDLDWKTHLEFGSLLKEQIMRYNKRVAVIASGDLSHALSTEGPVGFNPEGPKFDAAIQELLAAHNTAGLLNLDPEKVAAAAECGFRSVLILLGILRNVNYQYSAYSYEGPFGVGYLTANFIL